MPDPERVAEAVAKVGMDQIQLREEDFTVRFLREGMMLDLGAIGKGYAIERAAEILRESGVTSALVHGGTSTVHAIGSPPNAETWKIAVQSPGAEATSAQSLAQSRDSPGLSPHSVLAVVPLKDEAMSVSAVHGRSFTAGGKIYGHVIDPRSGHPTQAALLAAVVLPSATESDALSTALLIAGPTGHEHIASLRGGMRTLVAFEAEDSKALQVETNGIERISSSSVSEKPLQPT
jgi:thiamine biosynthesis lipoprotein